MSPRRTRIAKSKAEEGPHPLPAPKKIATGIYKTASGFHAFVRVSPTQCKSKRFGPHTLLKTMKDWRESARVKARETPQQPVRRGTLAADIAQYLQLVAAMPTLAWRKRDLHAWTEALGTTIGRADITPTMIRATLHRWRTEGPRIVFVPNLKQYREVKGPLSASACNHRRTALLHLYTLLDGKGAPNPVKEVPPFREPAPEPRGRDLDFLVAAIARMRNPKHRARASVLLWTGMRGNSELAKMTRGHVDLEARVCYVPSGKGGTKLRTVPLNDEGVAAWQEFISLKLWGKYDRNYILRSFRRACRVEAKARGIDLPRVRLYDARHSLATSYLKAGADLADVQELLGHSTARMTRRYAPYQPPKLAAVSERLSLKR